MPQIDFGRDICGNLAEALGREWLETNGLGGFAAATVTGANTRRYHGLLVAATQPPAVRHVLLSKLEEILIVDGRRFELATNLYSGATHPEGYRYLTRFRLDPFPIFTFEAGGVTIEKRVFLVHGENTAAVEYAVVEYDAGAAQCGLEVRPLVAFRGYHDLTQANQVFDSTLDESEGAVSIQPYAPLPRLWFAHNAASLAREAYWYFDFEYPRERERGLDFREDLFCPFVLRFDLGPGKTAGVIASTAAHNAAELPGLKAAETARRAAMTNPLRAAADQFVVARGELHSVIAGYPWFTDWGRDTMIALPGLTLATGKFDVARDILLEFAACLDQGMLPNSFTHATPDYNTADATLWFFEAIRKYLEYSNDAAFVRRELYEKLKEIVDWHVRGTRYGIHADQDGLLAAGDASTSLTWMDARVGGSPVTPRNGKPVEIQALWYNALRFTGRLAGEFGDDAARTRHEDLAARAAGSFDRAFWNEHAGYYADVVDGTAQDPAQDLSLRPNQAIALSLGYCAVPAEHARKMLDAIERHLLTPFGLRTLSPLDPRYVGRYEGSPAERDSAYHQGTVWPWLLGPYMTAARKGPELLDPLRAFLLSRGTGQLPECFDGDAPHEPRGCFAQAWSVAEALRLSASSATGGSRTDGARPPDASRP